MPDPSAPDLNASNPAAPIRLVYELCVPPGRLAEVQAHFRNRYLPAAADRGMNFAGAHITPPIELDDASTTLVISFEIADANAVWAMKRVAASSAEVAAFWQTIDGIVESRTRRFLAPVEV